MAADEGNLVEAGRTFRTERDGDDATVIVKGEIDLAEAGELERLLTELVGTRPSRVVVDLHGVDFMGSAGLGALVTAHNRIAEHGGSLRLRAPSPSVRRVLQITTLDQVMPVDE